MLNGWTALILLALPGSFPGSSNQRFFGQRPTVGADLWALQLSPNTNSTLTVMYASASFTASSTLAATPSEDVVVGGGGDTNDLKYGFWKGQRSAASMTAQTLAEATAVTAWIGGVNDNNSGSVWGTAWSGNIKAVVVYNRVLTEPEISKITAKMAALTSSSTPPVFCPSMPPRQRRSPAEPASAATVGVSRHQVRRVRLWMPQRVRHSIRHPDWRVSVYTDRLRYFSHCLSPQRWQIGWCCS